MRSESLGGWRFRASASERARVESGANLPRLKVGRRDAALQQQVGTVNDSQLL
jgi:hypothetical protein